MACEPDIIFIGGRLSRFYDALSEIAPVVYLSTNLELGLVESTRSNAATIASIFGKTGEVESLMVHSRGRHLRAGYDAHRSGERAAPVTPCF